MGPEQTLFDGIAGFTSGPVDQESVKEDPPVDRLKNLEEKITVAVERVKALKEEKGALERKIRELEELLNAKNQEISSLQAEKITIKGQIEELLEELETIEL